MSRDNPHLEPHRGQMIMILGIVSLFVIPPILGPIAWYMGNQDLKKMDAGTMDPAGRDNTKLGKIIGMVATILSWGGILIGLFFCVCAGILGIGSATMQTRP
jgi:hypothetical protein